MPQPFLRPDADPLKPVHWCLLALPTLWLMAVVSGPVQWMDSGYFMREASEGPWLSPQLGALSHPSYHLVLRGVFDLIGPWGVAWLNTALVIPITLLLHRLALSLGLSQDAASVGTACGLLAHCTFWVASKVEVYDLHLLWTLAAYWVCWDDRLRWSTRARMVALGVFTGLGVTTHQLTLVVLLPLYVHMLSKVRLSLAWILPGLLIGLMPMAAGLSNELASGKSLFTIVRHYLTGHAPTASANWEGAFGRLDLMWRDKSLVAIWALSLAGLQAWGLYPPGQGDKARTLWLAALLNALFAMSYAVPDRFTFFLPGATMLALLGAHRWSRRWDTRSGGWPAWSMLAPLISPLLLTSAWACVHAGWLSVPQSSAPMPPRDDVRYFLAPYLPDNSAAVFVARQLEHTTPGSLIAADYTPLGALASAKVAGLLPERRLVACEDLVGQERPAGDVYLVRETYCEHVRQQFGLQATGGGWQLPPVH